MVHEYDAVDREQIFAIVKKHLPILKIEVENILKKHQVKWTYKVLKIVLAL